MINGIRSDTMVATLLDTLEKERHLRKPLLFNLVDELSADDHFGPALDRALDLLQLLEAGPVSDAAFARRLAELRELGPSCEKEEPPVEPEA
jgi:hypothetical protein